MRFAAIVAALILSGNAAAQEACREVSDAALRLGCYEKAAAVPPQCAAYGTDWIPKVACLDLQYGRPIAPHGADEARMCLALKPDPQAVAKCFEVALAPPKATDAGHPDAPDATPTRRPDAMPAKPTDVPPDRLPLWTVQVREQSLSRFYKLNEPAQVGYKRENGRSDPLLKAAVVADGPTLGFVDNWNWFLSTDVNIDLSAPGKQRANSKAVGAGARGILFDYVDHGFAVDSTVRLTEKIDSELQTQSTNLVLNNLLVVRGWADGAPWKTGATTWQIVPAIGLGYEKLHKTENGKPTGNHSSVFGGISAAIWPGMVPRTQLTLKFQRFVDTAGSASLGKRGVNYTSLSAEYFLYDPAKDNPTFTPRLALVHEVGSDPLTATLDKNRTLLVFKFTLN